MSTSKFQNEINIDLVTGGKKAIERLVEAYGFTTRQALADHLKISKSTLANRYLRDTFPADWIIKCTLETGVSLTWLTTGDGPRYDDHKSEICVLPKKHILDGVLQEADYHLIDVKTLPKNIHSPAIVLDEKSSYLVDLNTKDVSDGMWVVEVEGKVSVKLLTRIPVGKVKISSADNIAFECGIDEIKPIAKCHFILMVPI